MRSIQQIPYGNIIYVDGSRTDYYTPDGSIEKPYKTITTGITAGSNKTLYVAPATYTENISITQNIQIIGSNKEQCIINGSVTLNQSASADILVDIRNFTIYPTSPSSSTILNFGVPTSYSYTFNFVNCLLKANSVTYYVVETTTPYDMIIYFYDCTLQNVANNNIIYNDATDSASYIYAYNTKLISSASYINVDTGCSLIYTLDALSTVPTYTGSGTTSIVYDTDDFNIKNNSTVSGTTIKDALDTVDTTITNLTASDIATSETGTTVQDNLDVLNFSPSLTAIYVDGGRGDTYTSDGSYNKPYKTLTSAVSAASNGQTLIILPATYNESLTLNTKGLNFVGLDKNTTIITGSQLFYYNCSFKNLTFSSSLDAGIITLRANSGDKTYNFTNCNIICTYAGTSYVVDIGSSSTTNKFNVYFNQCYVYNGASTANPIYGISLTSQTTGIIHDIFFRGTYFGYNSSNINASSKTINVTASGGFKIYLDAGTHFIQQNYFGNVTEYLESSTSQINNDSNLSGNSLTDALNGITASDIATTTTGMTVQDELDSITFESSISIYVDNTRTDTYTETGTIACPFKTIPSAINAAKVGNNVIYISPGSYSLITGAFTLPAYSTGKFISLIGESKEQTVITVNNDGLNIPAGQTCRIAHLTIQSSSTSYVGCSIINDTFAGNILIDDCYLIGAAGIGITSTSVVPTLKIRDSIIVGQAGSGFGALTYYNNGNATIFVERCSLSCASGSYDICSYGATPVRIITLSRDTDLINASTNNVIVNYSSFTINANDIPTSQTGTTVQEALDEKEFVSNKSTSTSLGTSDTLYPTQNAVKTYVDTADSGKVPTTTTINGKPLSSDVTLTASDITTSSTGTDVQEALDSKIESTNTQLVDAIINSPADTKQATGIPWNERQKFKVSVSYSAPNVVATISFVGANTSFSYYISGKKFTVTSSELSAYTKSETAAEGIWFFYINQNTTSASSPILGLTQSVWNIFDPDVLLWNFSYNASDNSIMWVGEERHTAGRDIYQHARNHSQGALYRSGFLFSQYNGISSASLITNNDTNFGRSQINISDGSFWDEDIKNTINHSDSSYSSTVASPSTNWDLTVNQFLGFTALADTGTTSTSIVFPTSRTLATGQAITVMAGNTTTVRGTTTITTGGTGTTFTVSSVTGLTSGDAIVVGGRFPIYYYNASSSVWRKLATGDFAVVKSNLAATTTNIATGLAQYNDSTNGTFTAGTSNRFIPMFLVATNSISEPIICICGQGESTSNNLTTALTETPFQFQNLSGLNNLNYQEAVPFYRITFLNTNNIVPRVRDATFLNLRVSTVTGSVIGAGTITLPASSINTDTTNFNGILSGTDTTVQIALDTIDNITASSIPTSTTGTDVQEALDLKEVLSNKSTNTALGTSDTLYPTQNAVKTYVDDYLAVQIFM